MGVIENWVLTADVSIAGVPPGLPLDPLFLNREEEIISIIVYCHEYGFYIPSAFILNHSYGLQVGALCPFVVLTGGDFRGQLFRPAGLLQECLPLPLLSSPLGFSCLSS